MCGCLWFHFWTTCLNTLQRQPNSAAGWEHWQVGTFRLQCRWPRRLRPTLSHKDLCPLDPACKHSPTRATPSIRPLAYNFSLHRLARKTKHLAELGHSIPSKAIQHNHKEHTARCNLCLQTHNSSRWLLTNLRQWLTNLPVWGCTMRTTLATWTALCRACSWRMHSCGASTTST